MVPEMGDMAAPQRSANVAPRNLVFNDTKSDAIFRDEQTFSSTTIRSYVQYRRGYSKVLLQQTAVSISIPRAVRTPALPTPNRGRVWLASRYAVGSVIRAEG